MATMDIEGTLTFDPVREGTRDLKPPGLLKLLGPAIVRIGRRQEEAIWSNLKRLLDAGDNSPVAGV